MLKRPESTVIAGKGGEKATEEEKNKQELNALGRRSVLYRREGRKEWKWRVSERKNRVLLAIRGWGTPQTIEEAPRVRRGGQHRSLTTLLTHPL